MAALTPEKFCSVADGGFVVLTVDPGPHGEAELFERVVPFGTTATSSSPPFRRLATTFTEGPQEYRTQARVGGLYQARLHPLGAVPAGQGPTAADRPIGSVDLPCVFVESRDDDPLTSCRGDRAQLKLDVGDTWLGATLATGAVRTRMLLLVGEEEPAEERVATGRWPRFGERTPLASAASPGGARLHRLYAPPRVATPADDGIDPRTTVHWIAVVWTEQGRWSYVWASDSVGAAGQPQPVVTRTRDISVKVTRLTCIDDSFENEFGIAWELPGGASYPEKGDLVDDDAPVQLVLSTGGSVALAWKSFLWEGVDDGDVVAPPHLEIEWSGGAEGRGAVIILNSGRSDAEIEVPLPAGEGVRSSTHQIRAAAGTRDGHVGFHADLTVTVGYS